MSFDIDVKWQNGSFNTVNVCNLTSSIPLEVHWKFSPKNKWNGTDEDVIDENLVEVHWWTEKNQTPKEYQITVEKTKTADGKGMEVKQHCSVCCRKVEKPTICLNCKQTCHRKCTVTDHLYLFEPWICKNCVQNPTSRFCYRPDCSKEISFGCEKCSMLLCWDHLDDYCL